MQVSKWGNSLAVRLPAKVVRALKLNEGDQVELEPLGHGRLGVRRQAETDAAFERLRKLRGSLSADFKFDREEANSRGK